MAASCPSCGYPITDKSESTNEDHEPSAPQSVAVVTVRKSRGVFIILGILFGFFGIHNFYAGYYIQGTVQLLLGLITVAIPLMFILTLVILIIWVIADLIMTTHDSTGLRFA
jgi:TM2 domain-containing membrane protein YozV